MTRLAPALLLSICFFFLVIVLKLTQLSPYELPNHSRSYGSGSLLARSRLAARDSNTIPSSPPWIYPSSIIPPPKCMTTDRAGDCPQVTSLIGDCSAVQCIRTFVGGCV